MGDEKAALGHFSRGVRAAARPRRPHRRARGRPRRVPSRRRPPALRRVAELRCAPQRARAASSRSAAPAFTPIPKGSRRPSTTSRRSSARMPQSSPLFIKTVWLANLAHMTLGDYPDGVPERYRVAALGVRVGAAVPARSRTWRPSLGVGTWSLSGGAVFDDFDGDGDFDLLTTTIDTRAEPDLFPQRRRRAASIAPSRAVSTGLFGGLNLVQADYDNDGDVDVYVLRGAWLVRSRAPPGSLLRNDGTARFTDVTFAAGLGGPPRPTQTARLGATTTTTATSTSTSATSTARIPTTRPTRRAVRRALRALPQRRRRHVHRRRRGGRRREPARVRQGRRLRRLRQRRRSRPLRLDPRRAEPPVPQQRRRHVHRRTRRGRAWRSRSSSFPTWFWDFDNDGSLDLYVSTYAGAEDTVALVAASYFGLDDPVRAAAPLPRRRAAAGSRTWPRRWGSTASTPAMGSNFGDLDNDGWLDFYLGTGYPNYEGLMPNVMYRNVEGRASPTSRRPAASATCRRATASRSPTSTTTATRTSSRRSAAPTRATASPTRCSRIPATATTGSSVELMGTRSNRAGDRRADPRRHRRGGQATLDPSPGRQRRELRLQSAAPEDRLGKAERVERLEVWWPASGERQAWTGLAADTVVRIVEPR